MSSEGLHGLKVAASAPVAKSVPVRVAVRVRPFLKHETGMQSCIHDIADSHILLENYRFEGETLKYT